MAVIDRRLRLVSFRVFQREYEEFQNLCISEGASSLSDLARSALYRLKKESRHGETALDTKLEPLSTRLQRCERELERLRMLLDEGNCLSLDNKGQDAGKKVIQCEIA